MFCSHLAQHHTSVGFRLSLGAAQAACICCQQQHWQVTSVCDYMPVVPGASRRSMPSDMPRPAMILVGATMHARMPCRSAKVGTAILDPKATQSTRDQQSMTCSQSFKFDQHLAAEKNSCWDNDDASTLGCTDQNAGMPCHMHNHTGCSTAPGCEAAHALTVA